MLIYFYVSWKKYDIWKFGADIFSLIMICTTQYGISLKWKLPADISQCLFVGPLGKGHIVITNNIWELDLVYFDKLSWYFDI